MLHQSETSAEVIPWEKVGPGKHAWGSGGPHSKVGSLGDSCGRATPQGRQCLSVRGAVAFAPSLDLSIR